MKTFYAFFFEVPEGQQVQGRIESIHLDSGASIAKWPPNIASMRKLQQTLGHLWIAELCCPLDDQDQRIYLRRLDEVTLAEDLRLTPAQRRLLQIIKELVAQGEDLWKAASWRLEVFLRAEAPDSELYGLNHQQVENRIRTLIVRGLLDETRKLTPKGQLALRVPVIRMRRRKRN